MAPVNFKHLRVQNEIRRIFDHRLCQQELVNTLMQLRDIELEQDKTRKSVWDYS